MIEKYYEGMAPWRCTIALEYTMRKKSLPKNNDISPKWSDMRRIVKAQKGVTKIARFGRWNRF